MKKLIYSILVLLLVFISCKKDTSNPVDTTNSIDTNTVPLQPTLASPTDTSSNIALPVVLTWNESSGAKSYTLQVSTSSSFSSFVFNKSDIAGVSQQVTELNYLSVYYWKVRASNGVEKSDWSHVWSFETVGEPAFVPTLSSPLNGVDNQMLSTFFIWNKVSNAASYTLQISSNSSFSSFVYNGDGLTSTSKQITDLDLGTTYYWRVRATNKLGSKGWSETWLFKTATFICGTSTIDYSGKIYSTVQIGNQCWLNENLNVGTMILGNVKSSDNGVIEKYCVNNIEANCVTYGGLYQWDEAMQYVTIEETKGICPIGWHLPSRTEFKTLKTAVNEDGNALKAVGQGTQSGVGTDSSGFSALLCGFRNEYGSFFDFGVYANFWCSTDDITMFAYDMNLYYKHDYIITSFDFKAYGFSIRCLKD